LHTRDLASAILNLLKQNRSKIRKVSNKKFPMFNIGSGEVITIKQLSVLIANKLKFSGKVLFNHRFPDGTYKKNLDTRKMKLFGWKPKIKLKQGIDEILKTKFNVDSN
jgi:GDP-L-fucose synthase